MLEQDNKGPPQGGAVTLARPPGLPASWKAVHLLTPALPWLSTVLVIALWYLGARLEWLEPQILPGPDAVLRAAVETAKDGTLGAAVGASVFRAAVGSAIGLLLALLIGVASGFWRAAELAVDKPIQMARAIPFTALVPLFILWFGIEEQSKVLLVVWAVFVPLYLNTFGGIRNVDRRLVEVARMYRLSALEISVRVLLHGALPSVLTGLRYSLGMGLAVLIVAESVNAKNGIGALLSTARQYAQTDVVLLCISLYALLGLVTDALVRLLESRLLRWRHGFEAR